MKSIYKKILSIGLLGACMEFALTRQAHAGFLSIDGFTSGAITFVSHIALGLLTYIAQVAFIMVGFFVELAMKLNNNILDPDQNIFVFKGWTVFVNVADLALVVGLIIIAFATMLNFQSYGMKKTLPKLILVALLVNFSLVIPGVLIDLAGMVTDFFVRQAGLTGSGMSSSLATAFNISGFMSIASKDAAESGANLAGVVAGQLGSGIMNLIMNMTFIVIFTTVATVILATMAIMLFLRYFILSFLLLMTPLIFVSWIFPGTKSHWSKWWEDFIRWTMFPPVMVFFMWLSLTALNSPSNIETAPATGSAWDTVKALMNFNLSALIHMAMAVMLMILSLVAANSISIKGAKGSKDMVSGMTGWGRGKIEGWGKSAKGTATGAAAYARRESERGARRMGTRAGLVGTAVAGRVATKYGVNTADLKNREGEGKFGGRLSGIVGRAGEKISATQQAALKKTYDDKFKGMSEDNLAMRYSTMGNDEKVFAAQQLAAKGKLNKVNGQLLDRDIKDGKERFEAYGGAGSYDKITKAAGRNAEMIDAKGKEKDNEAKMKDIENKIDAVQKSSLNQLEKNKQVNELDKEKAELKKKGGLNEAAEKFYDKFERKDFVALGSKFYKEDSPYGTVATRGMLKNEPSAFGTILSGMESGEEAKSFNANAIKIIESMKEEALEIVKTQQPKITDETNKELLSVMRGMKEFNEQEATDMKAERKLEWIRQKDERVHAAIGGEKLATTLEQQLKFLQSRKNSIVINMEEVQNYRRSINTEETLVKSMTKRLYGGSEKKDEAKA